jgi:holin-like protein
MLAALTQLLLFQLAGEVTARGLGLPVPGPVLGMLLLFGWLILRDGPSDELRGTTQNLLQHLSLLFVPAGTGVMLHLGRLRDEWLAITVALVVSTFIGMIVTGVLLQWLIDRRQRQGEHQGEQA